MAFIILYWYTDTYKGDISENLLYSNIIFLLSSYSNKQGASVHSPLRCLLVQWHELLGRELLETSSRFKYWFVPWWKHHILWPNPAEPAEYKLSLKEECFLFMNLLQIEHFNRYRWNNNSIHFHTGIWSKKKTQYKKTKFLRRKFLQAKKKKTKNKNQQGSYYAASILQSQLTHNSINAFVVKKKSIKITLK